MSLDNGLAGWGWVPDVHPNPQNTAEAVCAYVTIGEQIPFAERVVKMLQADKTSNWSGQDWEFTTSIDWAWRLRALVMLDRSMRGLVEPRLIDRHAYQLVNLLRENGWSIAGDDGERKFPDSKNCVAAVQGCSRVQLFMFSLVLPVAIIAINTKLGFSRAVAQELRSPCQRLVRCRRSLDTSISAYGAI